MTYVELYMQERRAEKDNARRIASNIAKLPTLLGAAGNSELDFPEGGG